MTKTQELHQQVIDAYLAGASYKAAGEAVGISAKTSYDWIKEAGQVGMGGRSARTGSGSKKSVELYLQGKRYFEIARELKVEATTVRVWLERAGVIGQGGDAVRDQKDSAEAVQLYAKAMTIESIAKHLGRGTETVSGWLKAAGVELRRGVDLMTPEQLAEYSRRGVEARQAASLGVEREQRVCKRAECGVVFEPPAGRRKTRSLYHSRECFYLDRTDPEKKVEITCATCGKTSWRFKSALKGAASHFCDRACMNRAPHGIQARFEDNVMQSRDEMAVFGMLPMFGIACERFNRMVKAEWTDGAGQAREYSPDLWLPRFGVALEIKGVEMPDDQTRWSAYRDQVGPLLVLSSARIRELIETGNLAKSIAEEAEALSCRPPFPRA